MSDIAKRLETSLRYDAINGDQFERSVVGRQIREAVGRLAFLEEDRMAHQRYIDALEAECARLRRLVCSYCCHDIKTLPGDKWLHIGLEDADGKIFDIECEAKP